MSLSVRPVRTRKELKQFVRFPWEVYKNMPYWVPPLIHDQLNFLSQEKGPFFEFGEAALFMAFEGDRPVGRISAHLDHQYERYRDTESGHFGFFEALNQPEAAAALFEHAEDWLRRRGKSRAEGPFNFTLYDASGMLHEGFDSLPAILLPYNPPYYNDLLIQCGYEKSIDWYAFMVHNTVRLRPTFYRIRDRILKQGIRIEKIDLKRLDEAVRHVGAIFNEAWNENWGHVPLTERQLKDLAQELKFVVDPDLAYLAFLGDQCIGFSLTIKDANPALQRADGRLFPFGLFKILFHMRKIRRLRTIAMGVLKEHRHRGLDILFYLNTIEEGIRKGYTESECSIIVETNQRMIRALEDLQAVRHKTYRFYQKQLA